METISNTLFWISNGLLVPVVVLLLLFFLRAIILAGGFFGEFYQRIKLQKQFTDILEDINSENRDERLQQLPPAGNSPLLRCLKKLSERRDNADYCERLLANYEVDAGKELGRSRTFIKLGPMLGLMGTLIPMGPALVGLAAGDISSMAYNMQVAFATTVVGMVIAAIGVVTLQVKQRWYAREMNDLEYLYKVLSTPVIASNPISPIQ
ncbi:MotA/TolQ/ExbB proton channel family protein [Bacteroides sp. GD17]|jgi:biopolymer transport protein ExbB/TolQ|uniref:MotA/TolQ/ExbB proton channel family protein n=1 Tax=Bacteroides sp. GD17 TaxID=3139826 RepID=UPI0025D6B86D|nr:MotA/TolQ/ExbB proton channel family protein [uncultured Bacteroides sp.]